MYNDAGECVYSPTKTNEPKKENTPFKVLITVNSLNYRAGAGTNSKINGTVKKGDIYTIVDTSGDWGKLKSGAGWISLNSAYVKRL